MSTASEKAGQEQAGAALNAADFANDFPDCEVFVYRNHVHRSEGYPNGFECIIAVPKAKIAGHWLADRARRNERVIDVHESRGKIGVTPCLERLR